MFDLFYKILRKTNILYLLDDETVLKFSYRYCLKRKLNLMNPQTFNEKLQWLKLYYRKSDFKKMVDKFEVKKYISNILGNDYIIPTLGIYNTFDEINFDDLPEKFVIKCTHDSGGFVICNDKNNFDIRSAKRIINKFMNRNYFLLHREWPYKDVKHRILIEKYMGDNLNDYKIFCFNGEPKFTLVCSNRNGDFKNTDFYDNNWNLMPFTRKNHDNNPNGISRPFNFQEMLDIAKKLSKNIPFVRVDLYSIDNCIYFGELTFFPSAGFEGFEPNDWDKIIGDMLLLPNLGDSNEK